MNIIQGNSHKTERIYAVGDNTVSRAQANGNRIPGILAKVVQYLIEGKEITASEFCQ